MQPQALVEVLLGLGRLGGDRAVVAAAIGEQRRHVARRWRMGRVGGRRDAGAAAATASTIESSHGCAVVLMAFSVIETRSRSCDEDVALRGRNPKGDADCRRHRSPCSRRFRSAGRARSRTRTPSCASVPPARGTASRRRRRPGRCAARCWRPRLLVGCRGRCGRRSCTSAPSVSAAPRHARAAGCRARRGRTPMALPS